MSCYKHFTTKERESLLVLLKKGRRKRCVRHYKLSEPDYARKVSELLVAYWSPEEISGRLKLEGNAIRCDRFSFEQAPT